MKTVRSSSSSTFNSSPAVGLDPIQNATSQEGQWWATNADGPPFPNLAAAYAPLLKYDTQTWSKASQVGAVPTATVAAARNKPAPNAIAELNLALQKKLQNSNPGLEYEVHYDEETQCFSCRMKIPQQARWAFHGSDAFFVDGIEWREEESKAQAEKYIREIFCFILAPACTETVYR